MIKAVAPDTHQSLLIFKYSNNLYIVTLTLLLQYIQSVILTWLSKETSLLMKNTVI